MNFRHLSNVRSFNRKEWQILSRCLRKENGSEFMAGLIQDMSHQASYGSVHYTIQDRAKLARAIAGKVADGMIGWHEAGRDCDCVQYRHGYNVEFKGLFALQRDYWNSMDGAEGPHSVWFDRPMARDEFYRDSRDLAMEAYEDGHPHVIYT